MWNSSSPENSDKEKDILNYGLEWGTDWVLHFLLALLCLQFQYISPQCPPPSCPSPLVTRVWATPGEWPIYRVGEKAKKKMMYKNRRQFSWCHLTMDLLCLRLTRGSPQGPSLPSSVGRLSFSIIPFSLGIQTPAFMFVCSNYWAVFPAHPLFLSLL